MMPSLLIFVFMQGKKMKQILAKTPLMFLKEFLVQKNV